MGILFTGSDETTLCVALDKALCKRVLSTHRVRTPRSMVITPGMAVRTAGLKFPVIVKPNAEGSSKGISEISVAKTPKELRARVSEAVALYNQPMLAEEYIAGREFTVGILGNGEEPRVFRPMEIVYRAPTQGDYHVYSYGVKQNYKRYIDYRCPADIDEKTETEMADTARRIYDALGCRDFSRIDFRLSPEGKLYFIEINPLPGLAPGYSDYPMLAEFNGVSYDELVLGVLRAGAKRLGVAL